MSSESQQLQESPLVTAMRRVAELEQQLAAVQAREKIVRDAALAFLDKLTCIEARADYRAVWESAWLHGVIYGGPTWEKERDAFKQALAEPDSETTQNG